MSGLISKLANGANRILGLVGIDLYETYRRRFPQFKYWSASISGSRNKHGGISVICDVASPFSLSQVGRDFIDRLLQTQFPFSILDIRLPFTREPKIPEADFARYRPYCKNRIDDPLVIQFAAGDPIVNRHHPVIFTPFWEFQSGLFEDSPRFFDGTRGAIVFSKFCYDYFRANAPEGYPIWRLPYPLNLKPEILGRVEMRQRFGIPDDCFAVFFNFDIRSGYDRKNPEGALEAFAIAFLKEPKVRFVLKVSSADSDCAKMAALSGKAAHLGIADRLILITDNLARKEMLSLIASCDAYLSLHRGEGLGLGMLEAMSVGVPVIATDYGGNTDFCTEETAFLVPYRLVKPLTAFPLYKHVKEWAEPDVEIAAKYLKSVFADHALRKAKAQAAKRFVEERYEMEEFARIVATSFEAKNDSN